ncbi:MAG: hypothetical protein C4532_11665 [Candidatus Abyssobacteria bacterium SURF_17]|uniref:Phosphatidate cytidylyltransferase n=1 Tax=Candidatus Abyssobacteria bacterium SURF_17 TaxID=2093361 RepID=A0A419EWF2_9BACT|nr:MAG: hypothetical protein C4532_11665 [Candidatus Abyssubacteria bacterium SURF_17]
MENEATQSELERQVIHILAGAPALLLRWLNYPQALALAVALIIWNLFLLPRFAIARRHLYRPEEQERGFSAGIAFYPVSVFVLILLFPVPVAASMWGVLAVGDGMASFVGSLAGRRRVPWNHKKSLDGLFAFVAGGAPSAMLLYWWTIPNIGASPSWWQNHGELLLCGTPAIGSILLISAVTTVFCALLETIDIGIDDNVLVPLGGACVMTGLVHALCG